jgi:P27 family predicted phage terminase small subunit
VLLLPQPAASTWPPLEVEPAPHELRDARALAEWRRVVPALSRQVTTADRTVVVAYCQKYGQWLRLEEEVLRRPMTEDAGATIKAIRIANQTLVLVLRAAAELGLTPATRPRALPPAPSKWGDALR